jgi:hypothetical protein
LAKGVQELQVRGVKRKEIVADTWKDIKERVSFGTNSYSGHDLFDDEPKGLIKTPNMLAAERFMARKFDGKGGLNPGQTPAPKRRENTEKESHIQEGTGSLFAGRG